MGRRLFELTMRVVVERRSRRAGRHQAEPGNEVGELSCESHQVDRRIALLSVALVLGFVHQIADA